MEILFDKKDAANASLTVKLTKEDYKSKVDHKIKDYTKKVSIKGFRPGKVPAAVVQKMYGKSLLVEEVSAILAESINTYINENKLRLLGEPLPDNEATGIVVWNNEADYAFVYNLGLVPDFTVDLTAKTGLTAYDIEVNEKSVQETLENLKQQFGEMVDVETSSEGDFINGKLKEVAGTFESTTLLPTSKLAKSELKKFIGLKVGDTVSFDIQKAFDNDAAVIAHFTGASNEVAATMSGQFEFTVETVRHTKLPEMNQELFDKVFGKDAVTSVEEFNIKLKETIVDNYKRESKSLLSRELQKALVENTKIDLPSAFLKRWLLTTNEGKISQEQIETEFDYYAKELKWNLIQNQLAEKNNIKVENNEVLDKTKEMMRTQFGGMPLDAQMEEFLNKFADNYLKEEKGKNYLKIYEQIVHDKTMEHLLSNIKLTTKKVNVEQFQDLMRQDA
jgi:trigger factor